MTNMISMRHNKNTAPRLFWQGPANTILSESDQLYQLLTQLDKPLYVVQKENQIGMSTEGYITSQGDFSLIAYAPSLPIEQLGSPDFRLAYRTSYAYYAGSMANGISSEELVVALGKAGFLASFGAGGCSPTRIESAIQKIKSALPTQPFAFNLLNSPNEPDLERRTVELYLQHGIRIIEASAYMMVTANLVWYRAAGLSQDSNGETVIGNRIIAKLSRKEVARRFLSPAPTEILNQLVNEGRITPLQAELALKVPMADDITVEADSGGHTDNRPLVGLVPAIRALRDELQEKYRFAAPVRVGAAGGIGTPEAALAAFMLGADYIVTGSINQSCVEAGTSAHAKNLLAQAEMTDVAMAPAADMFEMGVKVQVLKRGTMFAMRAQKLYELYSRYESLEEIPPKERERLETQVFKKTFGEVWDECVRFFSERDPRQLERAQTNSKDKMALVFRWYLGLSSRWSNTGEPGREMDYQIWCGPAMGMFNDWVRGTYLSDPANRRMVDVTLHLLTGAAYLARVRSLEIQGIHLPDPLMRYIPEKPLI